MSGDRLTPLQWRILRNLAGLKPAWTLTGGAALAGVYLKHRTTQDLDLFWRGRSVLGSLPREAEEALRAEGLGVARFETGMVFRLMGKWLKVRVSQNGVIVRHGTPPQTLLKPKKPGVLEARSAWCRRARRGLDSIHRVNRWLRRTVARWIVGPLLQMVAHWIADPVVTFQRLRVTDGQDVCVLDLAAQRASAIQDPIRSYIGGVQILIDSPHEILVNKLCALLGRAELRDLVDVQALVESGVDLDRALADAPRKDVEFSAPALAWVLSGFKPRLLARELGLGDAETEGIVRFDESFIKRLVTGETALPSG